jgi:uncharacterized protein YggE
MPRRTLPAVGIAAVVLVAAVVGAGLAFGAGSADATNPNNPGDRTITVSAQGSASATPDEAVVRVAVIAEGDDPAAVRDELANGSEQLRDALAGADVPDDAITTTRFDIREHRDRERPDEERPTYRGQHAFEVTLGDTDRVGAVVDASAGAGATVEGVAFTLSEETRDDLRDSALEDAMGDASRQAETLANASGLTVTGASSIDATHHGYAPVRYDAATVEAAGGTTIDTGDVTVTANVRVTYNATV